MFTKIKHLSIIFFVILSVSLMAASAYPQNTDSELFQVAQKAFEDGFHDVAIRYVNNLLEEYPETQKRIPAQLLLGKCYFFKGQYLNAFDIFNNLLQYTEYKDETLFWLGETYLKGVDYKQAKNHYQQLIELYPDSIFTPQAYYSIGWIEFEENKFDEARKNLDELIRRFPENTLVEDSAFKIGEIEYNQKNYNQTIDAFTKYIEDFPHSTKKAEAFFYIAESFYYLNDPLTAITYYAKTAEISYDNKLILMAKISLGWSYLKLEKYKLAGENFDTALQFSQEKSIVSDDVYLGQATLFTQLKEFDQALKYYKLLIDTFPNSRRITEGYLGMANIYYNLEKYTTAVEYYQRIIAMYKNDKTYTDILEKAYFGLAWSYLKLNNIEASVKNFEAIKDRTDSKTVKISALTQIGDAYQDYGELEKAIQFYDQILRDYPESQYADYVQYRQGIALLKNDKIDAATLSFHTLRSNFPNSRYLADVNYYLAVAYFKKENWVLAKHQILEFLENLPLENDLNSESLYILGLSQFNLKEYDNATETFKKIIKNYPLKRDMIRTAEIGIAKSFYEKDEAEEAIKAFKQIVFKYPDSEESQESLIWLGDYFLEKGQYQVAIDHYQQFVKSFPGSESLSLIYYELGQSYAALEQYEQALVALNKIPEKPNKDLYIKARLAIADIFSKDLDPKSALETYENVITTSPEFKRDAYVKIADVHLANKNYENAIAALKEAMGSTTKVSLYKNSEIQFKLADTYQLLNQSTQAIDEYMKIPYLYPDDKNWVVKAYLRIGRIFEDEEKWEESIQAYQKVVELNADETKFAKERLEWIHTNANK
ncbi:MAG: tetratricopeptide repeat protein [Candidatus Omnitrophica bacterium]|nr:tetratricopeptide repeat protein [Candidatus Omnitrophota bacterium]